MNHSLDTQLTKVPVTSKRELLFFILNHCPNTIIQVNTLSNRSYKAVVINATINKEDSTNVILRLLDTNNQHTENYVHINILQIESIQINSNTEALEIFSLGTISKNRTYIETNKLEVQRLFVAFTKDILDLTTVNVGELQMDLPENKLVLNRILITTQSIKKSIETLLGALDAQISWKQKYSSIRLIDSDLFDVKIEKTEVCICFPFSNINGAELKEQELINKLMIVL